jgi:hypothetical protein
VAAVTERCNKTHHAKSPWRPRQPARTSEADRVCGALLSAAWAGRRSKRKRATQKEVITSRDALLSGCAGSAKVNLPRSTVATALTQAPATRSTVSRAPWSASITSRRTRIESRRRDSCGLSASRGGQERRSSSDPSSHMGLLSTRWSVCHETGDSPGEARAGGGEGAGRSVRT